MPPPERGRGEESPLQGLRGDVAPPGPGELENPAVAAGDESESPTSPPISPAVMGASSKSKAKQSKANDASPRSEDGNYL